VRETDEMHTGFWWRDPKERNHLEDLCVGGRVILKWIFKRQGWEAWAGFISFRRGLGGGRLRESGYETSGSIKFAEFLD
jgi:hypothetical protein